MKFTPKILERVQPCAWYWMGWLFYCGQWFAPMTGYQKTGFNLFQGLCFLVIDKFLPSLSWGSTRWGVSFMQFHVQTRGRGWAGLEIPNFTEEKFHHYLRILEICIANLPVCVNLPYVGLGVQGVELLWSRAKYDLELWWDCARSDFGSVGFLPNITVWNLVHFVITQIPWD